jgi:Flp pilus assembly protein CpaB
MSRKAGGYALLALSLVVTIGVVVQVYGQAQHARETERMESVDVLVAAEDIPERTLLTASSLTVKRMLPASLPPAAMSQPDQAVGQMTNVRIAAGDFLLPGKLAEADGRGGLAYAVPKGKVVMTLPGSDILTTGAIRAGDTVDVLVTIRPLERGSGTPPVGEIDASTTQGAMYDLTILAIGPVTPDRVNASATAGAPVPPPTSTLVTVAVEPQDALTLKALKDSERVKLELVLRAAGDHQIIETEPATIARIARRLRPAIEVKP